VEATRTRALRLGIVCHPFQHRLPWPSAGHLAGHLDNQLGRGLQDHCPVLWADLFEAQLWDRGHCPSLLSVTPYVWTVSHGFKGFVKGFRLLPGFSCFGRNGRLTGLSRELALFDELLTQDAPE
jgi:hypothetical protein